MFFKKPVAAIALELFLLLLDQALKWQVLHAWAQPVLFFNNWFGWEKFLNPGIAFGLPVPIWLALIFSMPILVGLIYFLRASWGRGESAKIVGLILIITGALSNILDRVLYRETVDYIRIFTGVFNIADGCIVLGVVVFLLKHKTTH